MTPKRSQITRTTQDLPKIVHVESIFCITRLRIRNLTFQIVNLNSKSYSSDAKSDLLHIMMCDINNSQGCKKIRKIVFDTSLTLLTKAKKTVISINSPVWMFSNADIFYDACIVLESEINVSICHLYHISNYPSHIYVCIGILSLGNITSLICDFERHLRATYGKERGAGYIPIS